jgi:hypothetical protein
MTEQTLTPETARETAEALRAVDRASAEAAGGVAALTAAMGQSGLSVETMVRDFTRGTQSLQTLWRRAVDDMLLDLARWVDGLHNGANGLASLPVSGDIGGVFGLLGTLAGTVAGREAGPTVTFTNPRVPLPAGAILPGEMPAASRGAQVVVAEGAVQITAGTLDDGTITRAADLLAEQIRSRLAFEDRQSGWI